MKSSSDYIVVFLRGAIEGIVRGIKNRSIHVPRTLRVLRLANATRCERGQECCGFDLVQKLPAKIGKTEQRPFGMAMCSPCVLCLASPLHTYRSWYAGHERIVIHAYSKVLCQPQVETCTGDPVGPLLLGKHIKQIENTQFRTNLREELLSEMLQKMDTGVAPEATRRAGAFITAFESAMEEYPAFQRAKRDVVLGRIRAKEAEQAARKLKNTRRVYDNLSSQLHGYEHKEIALACSWNDDGYCIFDYGPSQAILGPLLSAPSSATKKKIHEAGVSVCEAYEILKDKGFLGSGLSSSLASNLSSYEIFLPTYKKALYQYCCEHKTSKALLGSKLADKSFIGLLRKGKFFEALYRLLSSDDKREAFTRRALMEIEPDQRQYFRTIAEDVWCLEIRNLPDPSWLLNCFELKFDTCSGKFMRIKRNLKEYLQSPETVQFLAETGSYRNDRNQQITGQHVVNTLYEGDNINLLEDGPEFRILRRVHRQYIQRPDIFMNWDIYRDLDFNANE
jgi:flagellar biosynthesis chaperone FliJ